MTHAAEWGHWYTRDGKPCYEVPYADPSKGMRSATLKDAKRLGLVPGVTTIIQGAAKPGLERWKVTQGILSALTLPRLPDESLDAFADRAMLDSREQARKAAERGTAIHAAIQGHYEGVSPDEPLLAYVQATVKTVDEEFPPARKWQSEASFASPLGFGGKTDLCMNNEEYAVVLDFKTKEFADTDKKLAWDEQCIQLAAYREGLLMPSARCANVYVSVNNPGLVRVHEWPEVELQRGWKMFQALMDYFYARTGLARIA